VAIKLLPEELARDEKLSQRFEREARVLAKLDHPNLLHIFEVCRDADTSFFVTQLLQGRTLQEYLAKRKRPLALAKALPIMRGILAGVGHAHSQGVVHRDLKPGNVMLTRPGNQVVVVDFGIALGKDSIRLTRPGGRLGTLSFMAPEQIRGRQEDLGPGADIYACGVILYQLVSGRLPFEGEDPVQVTYQHMTCRPPPLAELGQKPPPGLEEALQKALEKRPEDRYPDTAAFLEALERVARGEPQPVTLSEFAAGRAERPAGLTLMELQPPVPVREPWNRGRWVAVAGLLAAALWFLGRLLAGG
jgi:serine/threonine-protein kinase